MSRGQSVEVAIVTALTLLAAGLMIGETRSTHFKLGVASNSSPSPEPSSSPVPGASDLDADIGAITVVSWKASLDWSVVRPVLANDRIGGVLLFTPNFGGDPGSLKELSDRLQALASSECLDHPLLVMLDQEGGAVSNVKASFSPPDP